MAYFTLALKSILIPIDVLPKKILSKLGGKNILKDEIPVYLIGQLGKNSNITHNPLAGTDILQYAIDSILKAREYVGGRIVLIECEDNPKLKEFYVQNGFFSLNIPSETESDEPKAELIQMVKII